MLVSDRGLVSDLWSGVMLDVSSDTREVVSASARPASGPPRIERRRWTINGDFLNLAPDGVARYAREVTLALDQLVAEDDPRTRDVDLDIVAPIQGREPLGLRALRLRVVPEFSRPRLPQVWVQAQLPRQVPGGLISFCNLAPVSVRRHIVCIHDLQTRLTPESYGRMFRLAHRLVLPALGRRAAAITTVSGYSRQHLVDHGVAPAGKITVTYNGSDHVARWDGTRGRLLPEARPYVLCLGRTQRHKNLELLVRLAPLLDAIGLDLWMAGSVDIETVRAIGGDEANLRLLGRISDDDFQRALSNALCFLFPSRTEGFGLPAVEAMACGCPLVASTSPCLPEVCQDAALYAGPDDLWAWFAAVERLQATPDLRRQLQAAGRERARGYSWRGIAGIYLDLMAEIDARSPSNRGSR
jgi:glycosyltransferase involved in cell wall biosynthesis